MDPGRDDAHRSKRRPRVGPLGAVGRWYEATAAADPDSIPRSVGAGLAQWPLVSLSRERARKAGGLRAGARRVRVPAGKYRLVAGGSRCGRGTATSFFYAGDGQLNVVEIVPGPAFTMGSRRALFPSSSGVDNIVTYDVAPDGQRFVVGAQRVPDRLIVVTNWFAELAREKSR